MNISCSYPLNAKDRTKTKKMSFRTREKRKGKNPQRTASKCRFQKNAALPLYITNKIQSTRLAKTKTKNSPKRGGFSVSSNEMINRD